MRVSRSLRGLIVNESSRFHGLLVTDKSHPLGGLLVNDRRSPMGGLIVGDKRPALRGLIIGDRAAPLGRLAGLLVNDKAKALGDATDGNPFSQLTSKQIATYGFGISAISAVASYLLWKAKWHKLGGFVGFSAAAGVVQTLVNLQGPNADDMQTSLAPTDRIMQIAGFGDCGCGCGKCR